MAGETDHTRTGQAMAMLVQVVSSTIPHTQTIHHHLLLGGTVVAGVGTDNRDSRDLSETGTQVEMLVTMKVTVEVMEEETKDFSDFIFDSYKDLPDKIWL